MGSAGFGIAPTDLLGLYLARGRGEPGHRPVRRRRPRCSRRLGRIGLARSAEALDSLGEEIAALGGDFMPLVADISDLAAIEGAV